MSTLLQEDLAKVIVRNAKRKNPIKSKGKLVEMGGYSKTVAMAKPQEIINQKGVQDALREYGFTEDNAKRVVGEIMLSEKMDPNTRLRATDQVFKVRGSYATNDGEGSKTLILVISGETAKRYGLSTTTIEGGAEL